MPPHAWPSPGGMAADKEREQPPSAVGASLGGGARVFGPGSATPGAPGDEAGDEAGAEAQPSDVVTARRSEWKIFKGPSR